MTTIQLAPGAKEIDIVNALNALADGGTVVLPKDELIPITSGLSINVARRDITLDLNGSTLQQAANVSIITGRGQHPVPQPVSLGEDSSGNVTLTYADAPADLSFGAWVKVVADDTLPGDHLDPTGPTRMGQAMQVVNIEGNTVTLRGELIDAWNYATNVRATPYLSGQLVVKNGEITGEPGQSGRNAPLVQLRNTVDAQVEDLLIHDASGIGTSIVDSVNARITDVTVKNLADAAGALGIGVHSLSSFGTAVSGLYAENVTHAADDNAIGSPANSPSVSNYGGDIGMLVQDSVAYATRNFAWSWHSEAVNGRFDNVLAFDSHGFLMARGIGGTTTDSGGANNQRGIAFYQWGDGDGRNITIDNVTLKETQFYSTIAINNPRDNLITDSYFESFAYTTPLDPQYATTINSAYVRTNAGTLDDTITGTSADELLLGAMGDDTILGGAGNDLIWGGNGNDMLTGGGGRDRFAFHALDEAGDAIADFQGGFFGDVIDLSVVAARFDWPSTDLIAGGYVRFLQDGADVQVQIDTDGNGNQFESLATLREVDANSIGAANLLIDLSAGQSLKPAPTPPIAAAGGVLYGSDSNDVFYADAQYPDLVGNGGDDLLFGSAEDNRLDGGAGTDALIGESGNDVLDGGSGPDWMEGGAGDDTYHVDDPADLLVERDDGGFDTALSNISLAEALAANVEALTLTGAALAGTGNALDNVMTGNAAANTFFGGTGHDALTGLEGNDRLYGETGDDLLTGGAGNDSLYGGDGNDAFRGDSGADAMSGSLGYDTVSYADADIGVVADLQAANLNAGSAAGDSFSSIENLTGSSFADSLSGNQTGNVLEGAAGNDHLQGRDGSDSLRGDDGDDVIDGGARKDILTGGAGEDIFHFASPADGGDTIVDFALGDSLALSAAGFGIENADGFDFTTGNAALTAKPTAIYESESGRLLWDSEGQGLGQGVVLATLSGAPQLAHQDFLIV